MQELGGAADRTGEHGGPENLDLAKVHGQFVNSRLCKAKQKKGFYYSSPRGPDFAHNF
jgi:hypothetical protein